MKLVKKILRWFPFTILFTVLFSLNSAYGTESLNLFRIGTGGKTGVYYPIGNLIAQGISNRSIVITKNKNETAQPYFSIAQNSGGSIDNVKGILNNEIEAGLVQADVAFWAFQGKNIFNNDSRGNDLRAIASLYPEKFQLVVRRDAKIQNMLDLKGKRISVDEFGSGTLSVVRIVLDAYGLKENDFQPVYLKPVYTHDKIENGQLHGFAMMAGAPMEAVNKLLNIGITIVPIETRTASKITKNYPYLVPGKIDSGIYPGIPETSTIQVNALLAVSKKMDEDLIYKITEALWSDNTITLLKNGHPQGKAIGPSTALKGLSIPLHPGAKRYYLQHPERFTGLK